MRFLLGIAIVAVVVFTAWSIEPTVGKTPTTSVSMDTLGMMSHTHNLPQTHFDDYSLVF